MSKPKILREIAFKVLYILKVCILKLINILINFYLKILLLELLLVEARASGLDGQYIKAKFNKNGRYKVDSNEGNH